MAGAERLDLGLDVLARDVLRHAEVEEGHAAVVHQQVVAGMRVAGEVAVAVERAEEEAEDDLAEAVARRAVELLHLLEADAVDPLAHEHVLASTARSPRPGT